MSAILPFPALVGLELAQQALLLLAIEPRLRGVVLAAPAGTGKSSLARGLRALLTDPHTGQTAPFIELPPSIDLENLLGGLDVDASLRMGRLVMKPGVLARAHGGLLTVDGLNLLSDASANLLLSALDDGFVRVEREGLSQRYPARFSLVAAYDPAEGPPRRHLLDRIGLIVPLARQRSAEQRAEVLRHNLLTAPAIWDEDLALLRGLIVTAREQLPTVTIQPEQLRQLSVTALAYGVEGQRADLFAAYAACAAAAFALRDEVEDEDLALAARLVILPRATVNPTDRPNAPPPPRQDADDSQPDNDPQRDTPPDDDDGQDNAPPAPPEHLPAQPEQILEALATALPDILEDQPFQYLRRGKSGSRGTTEGKRGRHVRSVPGDPKRARIDLVATLRAALPWQPMRANSAGRAALPWQPMRRKDGHHTQRVRLAAADLRVKQYRSKAGVLFCFVVDSSGSMALHRMRQAKGAIHTLLLKAYVNRDRVALIAFRGEQAELLLPASQSVELARRALDTLPTGGGTPLASALLLGCEVAEQARRRGIMQTVLILLTDGRANVTLMKDSGVKPEHELRQIGLFIQGNNLRVIVIDTKRSYLSRGEARQLAEWLGGEYAYLPDADGAAIARLVADE